MPRRLSNSAAGIFYARPCRLTTAGTVGLVNAGLAVLLPYISLFVIVWIFVRFIHELEEQTIKQEHSILPKALQERVKLDKHSLRLLVFVLRASTIFILVLTLLSMLGVSLAGLLAFGGLGGIVIGLALKDPIANFFAGTLLFWERP